jgi:hypothetical protein
MTDLPSKIRKNSETKVIRYFDQYFNKPVEIAASEYDAVLGFFEKREFDTTAARVITQVLITQARAEGIKVFSLIDTLQGLQKNQLSSVITKIINLSRDKTSQLGYKTKSQNNLRELRNLKDPVVTTINIIEDVAEDPVQDVNYIEPGYVQIGYVE